MSTKQEGRGPDQSNEYLSHTGKLELKVSDVGGTKSASYNSDSWMLLVCD